MDKYEELKRKFEESKDKENAISMAKYMRNLFSFYGIPTPKRKAVYKDFLKEEKKLEKIDWELLDQCYQDLHREFQYFVCDYLLAMNKYLTFEDIPKLKQYITKKEWWDTIDCFDSIIGEIGLRDNRVEMLMLEWSKDKDFWLRRIAINHQLNRKEKTNKELLEQIIVNNFGSEEFFINKAIGWSLREYSKTNPTWVKEFLDKYKDKLNKLSIREASKYI